MKKVLLLTVAILFAASAASAQIGVIGIYGDAGPGDCAIAYGAVNTIQTIWVYHALTGGAKASKWAAPQPACFNALYLADVDVYGVSLGSSQVEKDIGYGVCEVGTFQILGINYLSFGGGAVCCEYPVVPAPSLGIVQAVDCADVEVTSGSGASGTINPDGTCPCAVPTEETTWGTVKALYNSNN
jgi:hypothetical protein